HEEAPVKETAVATKIVLSPKLPAALVDIARSLLPAGFQLEVADQGTPEFSAAMKDAEYFVGFARESLGGDLYRCAPTPKRIQLIGPGYDRLDVAAARRAGVPVANNGGSNSVAVAEHTLMLMLAVSRKLAWHHHNVITGKWRVGDFSQTRMYELAGKTLGIVGLGTIGKKVAARAQAFDMHVQYYAIIRLPEAAARALPRLSGPRGTLPPPGAAQRRAPGHVGRAGVRDDEAQRDPDQPLPGPRGGRGGPEDRTRMGADPPPRPRRHGGGAAGRQ